MSDFEQPTELDLAVGSMITVRPDEDRAAYDEEHDSVSAVQDQLRDDVRVLVGERREIVVGDGALDRFASELDACSFRERGDDSRRRDRSLLDEPREGTEPERGGARVVGVVGPRGGAVDLRAGGRRPAEAPSERVPEHVVRRGARLDPCAQAPFEVSRPARVVGDEARHDDHVVRDGELLGIGRSHGCSGG